MLIRKGLGGLLAVGCVCIAVASCSSSNNNDNGNGNGGTGNLVSTCNQICSGIQSCVASSLLLDCQDACSQLSGLQGGCLSDLVDYLACLGGATSISCTGGQLHITLGACASQKDSLLNCNAGPGIFSACFALSGSTACTSSSLPKGNAEFCIGVPSTSTGCVTPNGTANPIGIGTYCCP